MTATVTTAPTEEEIRAAIAREWRTSIDLDFSDAFTRCMTLADGMYDLEDLRESEVDRLNELTYAAVDPIRADARRQINEALVSAALTFAAEHPDAPRATRKLAIV